MSTTNRRTLIAAASCAAMATSLLISSTPPASAAATCRGLPAEVLTATWDESVFSGTDGDDVVVLRGDDPSYRARAGDDTVCIESVGGAVDGDAGDDWISGAKAREGVSVQGHGGEDTLIGSAFRDHFYDSDGDDLIRGGAENDTVWVDVDSQVDNGHDMRGGPGRDLLRVDSVDDRSARVRLADGTVRGPDGLVARFRGFNEYDVLGPADVKGSDKADRIWVAGDVTLSTGGGDDVINSRSSGPIRAGAGDDTVLIEQGRGPIGAVRLGSGDDAVTLANGNGGTVRGGSGDDLFKVRPQDDNVDDDRYPPSRARLLGQSGSDTLTWSCKATVRVGDDRLKCAKKPVNVTFGGMQVYRGSKRNDTFRGGAGPDVFYGRAGNDTMYGKKGRDKLIGGKGYDIAYGGPGKDICRANKEVNC